MLIILSILCRGLVSYPLLLPLRPTQLRMLSKLAQKSSLLRYLEWILFAGMVIHQVIDCFIHFRFYDV